MKKKWMPYLAGMLAGSVIVSQAAFADTTEIINRTDLPAPEYKESVIFQSGANNPNETTRYEGVPNLLFTSPIGFASYLKLGEGNYCTQLKSGAGNPYINFTDRGITEGTYIISMDIAKTSTHAATQFLLFGTTTEGANKLCNVFNMKTDGTIGFDSAAKGIVTENYEKIKKYNVADTPNENTWLKVKLEVNPKEMTYDLYINEWLICDDTVISDITKSELSNVKGWRVQQNNSSVSTATFLDNYYVGYLPEYNTELCKGGILNWIDKSDAVVRRIPIKTDRYRQSVVPSVMNGTPYIPLRYIADCHRADIGYDESTGIVSVGFNGKLYTLRDGSNILNADGREITMDSAAVMREDCTLVPVSAAAKMFDTNVYYDGSRIFFTNYSELSDEEFDALFGYWEAR